MNSKEPFHFVKFSNILIQQKIHIHKRLEDDDMNELYFANLYLNLHIIYKSIEIDMTIVQKNMNFLSKFNKSNFIIRIMV